MPKKLSTDWPADADASWTDETLPLEVRWTLLDKALARIKAQKDGGNGHPANRDQPDHPGESGAESPRRD